MKKELSVILTIFLVISFTALADGSSAKLVDYKIEIDGTPESSVTFNINDRTYVPLRGISELFGMEVLWDAETESISINTLPEIDIENKMSSDEFSGDINVFEVSYNVYVDGVLCKTGEKIYNINGRTFVPLRAISGLLNKNVDWDGDTETVYISDPSNYMLYPFQKDGLYGFMDEDGNILVEPEYEFCTDFSDGFGIARDTDGYEQYVDINGNVSEKNDSHALGFFSEGVAARKVRDYKEGEERHTFDGVDGIVKVFDKEGNIFIDEEFEDFYGFTGGIARVVTLSGNSRYINKAGEKVKIPGIAKIECSFDSGYLSLEQDGKETLYDNKMNRIPDIEYDSICDVCDGFVVAKKGNSYGAVDMENHVLIDFGYSYIKYIGEGLFAVRISAGEQKKAYEIKNALGEKITGTKFKDVLKFKNGVAVVVTEDNDFALLTPDGNLKTICKAESSKYWERVGNLIRIIDRNEYNEEEEKDEVEFHYINFDGETVEPK